MDEVGQQSGHREKGDATAANYTADDPAYLRKASKTLSALVLSVTGEPAANPASRAKKAIVKAGKIIPKVVNT